MNAWIKALGLLLVFAPHISLGGILPFPAESCQSVWDGQDEQSYLFDFKQDKDYSTFLKKLSSSGKNRKECHKTWTVLIYMSATKDLVPYAYLDLLEMEAAHLEAELNDPVDTGKLHRTGSSIRTDVIVQLMSEADTKISRLHMFESPMNQYKDLKRNDVLNLKRSQIYSPEIMSFKRPLPVTESQLFEDFLKWAVEEYPSEYYFVIPWGHGQGWTSITSSALKQLPKKSQNRVVVAPGRFGGLALNGNSDYLDMPSLAKILKNFEGWTGAPVAVFASDACLMQSVEDAAELAESTQYICGSEDVESYVGFPYGRVLCQLNSGIFHGAATKAKNEELSQSEPFLLPG